jgi:hypothetical protein
MSKKPYDGGIVKVGYWWSKSPENQDYPQAVARDMEWVGKWEFLNALRIVESAAIKNSYKGWSTCRICGCRNGSSEYTYKGFRWPSGFDHYIENHNIKPPLAFRDMVMRQAGVLVIGSGLREDGLRVGPPTFSLLDEKEVRKLQRLLQSHLRVEFAQGDFKFIFAGAVVATCSLFH